MKSYKSFMYQAFNLSKVIKIKEAKVEKLENLCSPKNSYKIGDGSSHSNLTELKVARWSDEKAKLETLYKRYENLENSIVEFITENLNGDEIEIMMLKYLSGKTTNEIAHELNFSGGTVRNRICKCDKILEDKYKLIYQ